MGPEAFDFVEVPGGHHSGGKMFMCVCASRAGNDAMWEFWFDLLFEFLEKQIELADNLKVFDTWSRQGFTTLDGEHQQLAKLITPSVYEKFSAIGHSFSKLPSGTSGATQPNDLMKAHTTMHRTINSEATANCSASKDVHKWFTSVCVRKLWGEEAPTKAVQLQFARMVAGFTQVMHKCLSQDMITKGYDKAGQGSNKIDFVSMAAGWAFGVESDKLAVWEAIGRDLAVTFQRRGAVTEGDFDAREPNTVGHSTLSLLEKKKKEDGTEGIPRDQRTLCQQRAVHLTTAASVAARADDLRQQEDYLKLASEKKDEEARKKDAKRKEEVEKAKAAVEKKSEDAKKKVAAAAWSSVRTLCSTLSMDWKQKRNAKDCICDACGISYDCVVKNAPLIPSYWENGWKECGRPLPKKSKEEKGTCLVYFCPECVLHNGGSHMHRHDVKHHSSTQIDNKHAKRISTHTKATVPPVRAPAASASSPAPPLPAATCLSEPPCMTLGAEDLLNAGDFHKFSEDLFGLDEREFGVNALANIKELDEILKDRLQEHIFNHPKVTPSMRLMYAWDYVRQNMSRMLAWKILQGYVHVECGQVHDVYTCYLSLSSSYTEIDSKNKDVYFGSYVVWDTHAQKFRRSGKAIDNNKRIGEHTRDAGNPEKATPFYEAYRHRWGCLQWYHSLALGPKAIAAAASCMYVSPAIHTKLEKAKWGGRDKTAAERACEMMAYLSELVDDLLMDSRETTTSMMPGFEGPLNVFGNKKTA
jgi:hypothetical protein